MAAATTCPGCCVSPLPLCLCWSGDQFVVVASRYSSPLSVQFSVIFFLFLIRFGRSSRSCLFFVNALLVFLLLYHLYRVFYFPCYPGCCLLVIDAYVHTLYTPLDRFLPSRHYLYIRSLCTSLLPHSIRLVRFCFRSRFTCRLCPACATRSYRISATWCRVSR